MAIQMRTLKTLGRRSYFKSDSNDFKSSLQILNSAIGRFPNNEKLYNNRSYIFYSLGLYNSALEDANFMVKNFPAYPSSYYRRGEIYMATKKYLDAITDFNKVIELDSECKEARHYHREAMINYLCFNGKYSRICVTEALNKAKNNINQAKWLLASKRLSEMKHSEELHKADEDSKKTSCSNIKRTETNANDPLTDPSNPYQSTTIWVGNLTKQITNDVLMEIFRKYGLVLSIRHDKKYAFINYATPSMATKTMMNFPQSGLPVADTSLVIRFPNNIRNKPHLKQYSPPMKKMRK